MLESRTGGLASDATPGELVRTILQPVDREHARLLQPAGQAAGVAADAVLSAIQGYVVRISIDPEIDPGDLVAGIAAMADR